MKIVGTKFANIKGCGQNVEKKWLGMRSLLLGKIKDKICNLSIIVCID